MAATNLIIPEKDSEEGYEQPIDVHVDGVGAAGFYPQHPSGPTDLSTGLEQDSGNNLVLKDPVSGAFTLAQLLAAASGLPPASACGQVILSVDGAAFSVRQPLTQAGWLVSDLGIMLVTG
jgi:hypothetical protein